MTSAVWTAWLAEPTSRSTSGRGMLQLLEEQPAHPLVVVLARVDQPDVEAGSPRISRMSGAILMKFGRAPRQTTIFMTRQILEQKRGSHLSARRFRG